MVDAKFPSAFRNLLKNAGTEFVTRYDTCVIPRVESPDDVFEKERLDGVEAVGAAQVEQHHGDAVYLRHRWTSSTRAATWAGGGCGTIP